jgi:hypothetical protein
VISILREAHQAVEEARARGDTAPDPEQLEKLRQRYDEAAAFGITHNRLRDWHDGNHPGYALSCWLQEYKEQIWLFAREFAVEWTRRDAHLCRRRGLRQELREYDLRDQRYGWRHPLEVCGRCSLDHHRELDSAERNRC